MDELPSHDTALQCVNALQRSPWRRRLLVSVALFTLLVAPVVQKQFLTCAVCGMTRHVVSTMSFPMKDTQFETECSHWYHDNVEPQHAHIWVRGTYSESYSAVGIQVAVSNIAGRADGPLIRFSSGIRHLMYQRCLDPTVAREAFIRLSRWEEPNTTERRNQIAIERALANWEDAGLVGPWPISD
jgi:hypothetical protein